MQTAPNPWVLCRVCGVHPALAASEGVAQRAAVTQIGTDFSLLRYKKQQDTATSNFHKDAGQSAGRAHVWWAEVMQYVTVMQLNKCTCNNNSERQGYKVLWVSVP